ncbi:MAG: LytTR family transcriptional regulator [Coriobacteriaceae bacterium]|uniref:LytTR family DNA-binding domain-containing protein n=1 Tax=Tractidigestivibacter sp. TaxID=2847320 RepID=UPI002A813249|nr:LytTR family DNA-binding domain-containing protein [Tractidigestivibacter sp.]MCI6274925.1 LytTR family transcriptional regulator [Coriobacteriaceae bacterium]MCI6548952.1 LytTR family transcriptional regulator [Coriobacteriaceae bacterium]MCI7437636.1 LytTR family transcriptional regulator [Coriobacteriaceae bacterium]MDD7583302.1 LytTR family DNA-binding domain-containing protein [Coriobacteriaceae bacterium]MDY4533981.1 LytTR family DNA-binding domain-containing protein [Tractidigestivib
MKVRLIQREGQQDIEVTVLSAPGDKRAERIADSLRTAGGKLAAYISATGIERRVVPLSCVSSIRSNGDCALVQLTDGTILHSPSRLGELETSLHDTDFVRTSRQELVNLDNVETIRPEFGSRLLLGLRGGGETIVSRSYAHQVKERIGVTR